MRTFSLARLVRLIKLHAPTRSRWSQARRLVLRANGERDARSYSAARALYEEALQVAPEVPRLRIQYAHMLKEAGDYESAEPLYREVADALPDDPDIAIQLGHFYKVAGRRDEAEAAYRRAVELRPGWVEAQQELAGVRSSVPEKGETGNADCLLPELLPNDAPSAPERMREGFFVRRLGATHAWTRGGYRRVLRGIEAIHGFIVSTDDVTQLTLLADGLILHRAPVEPTLRLGDGQTKYVFNLWHDFSDLVPRPMQIELRASRRHGGDLVHRQLIDIVPAVAVAGSEQSDAIVGPLPSGGGTIEERINRLPSMTRVAERGVLPRQPGAILVQRADQLGDLICSVPALQRLRERFPDARLVLLATSGNADLARTLPMIDDVVVADFPEGADGRRTMTLGDQEKLRRRLADYRFDVAIDLGETAGSRALLQLSGAPFLYGFKDREFPWLSAGFELNARDPGNHQQAAAVPHKLLAMVEGLAAIAGRPPTVLRRDDIDPAMLERFGITSGERFAVLHTGARLAYSRWPGFADLARLLLERTDLKVVVMGEEALVEAGDHPRLITLTGRMAFDEFDALLQHCALLVGNDSGPKHLAALRGVPVISLHMARLNWSEWGQARGLVMSRRVPCAGCGISTRGEECGKQWACIRHITPEEVFEAARRLL
jgi:ADP-heptose:LPS heptosyltransferase